MVKYVVGIALNPKLDGVVLVKKTKPSWMSDKYNGPGGRVENGENSGEAMSREWAEEVWSNGEPDLVALDDWTKFAILGGEGVEYEVHFFYTVRADLSFVETPPNSDEKILFCSIRDAIEYMVPNLQWLIPMAIAHATITGMPIHTLQVSSDSVVRVLEGEKREDRPELDGLRHCNYPKPCRACNPLMRPVVDRRMGVQPSFTTSERG